MKPVHFAADVHLEDGRPEGWQGFFSYLAGPARSCGQLYLLGDVFHAWLGDDDRRPLAQEAIGLLRQLTEAGVGVALLWGNHDFMLGRGFARATGAAVLGEQTVAEHGGTRALLLHGDVLCTADQGYQRARRLFRRPEVRFAMRHLPWAARRRVAGRLLGGAAGRPRHADIDEVRAQEMLAAADAQVLVHGHVHQPGFAKLPDGRGRWTLPAWEPAGGPGGWLELGPEGFSQKGGWAS
ncbi:MAG: UDP-2,3-diacylglucosamine diphosphatase [Betaproteobacteria bacterium AqS2]|uniref:UDP-2,3-diacylglucosamine diphosphatase n=1 Tax=Candidatus Amphirhobacter heronislandensis TaxID=1732024 RepID=A0A930XX00_9GAMM|nr:UDP-2,3-diacylglucosamine diphosphatase [Betaproteobacteria bacterium AqS2]